MKDFNSVLQLFNDKNNSMDFCDDFQRIESILNHFDKYIKPFEKIQHKGGITLIISFIVLQFYVLFINIF